MLSKTCDYTTTPRWETVASLIRLHNYRRGAELGVFDGRFALHIVKNCPGVTLYAIDAFGEHVPPPKRRASREKCDCEHCSETRNIRRTPTPYYPQGRFFYDRLADTIQEERLGTRLLLIQGLTVPTADKITDNSLDFLFVDAGHSYEHVNADLVAWVPKVKRHGMIFGHDWNMESVRKAVTDFFGRKNIEAGLPDHVWHVKVESIRG